jgi:RHS repeat-associated protein
MVLVISFFSSSGRLWVERTCFSKPSNTRVSVTGEILQGDIESYQFGDGRISFHKDGTKHTQYRLSDHLGNTVVLFEDKNGDGVIQENPDDPEISEVLQRELYDPFGLQLRGTAPIQPSADQRYLYNGKEQMEGTGLYAYGFRYYDPVIGRFTGVDPIADQFAFVSGFNYAENSPIANIDLHGLQKWLTVFNDLAKFFGITTGPGPGNNNNPKNAREADQFAGRRAALTRTKESLEDVVEMQEMAFPLVGTINDAQRGNYGDAAISTAVDVGAIFIPGIKFADKAKTVAKLSDEVAEVSREVEPGVF